MISQLLSCSLLALLSGCFGTRPTTPAHSYQRSRILVLNQTAVMDTITAVLHGQVVGLCNQQSLPASVQLTSPGRTYREVAPPDGRFRFFHIPAGTYLITATCPAYGSLGADTIHLGSGAVSTIRIGLGCRVEHSK
jgi:hypothetical protein